MFRKFTFHEFVSRFSNTAVVYGGLFIATIILEPKNAGTLTIILLSTNFFQSFL